VTELLIDLVARFGYAMVFVAVGVESMGVPVPGETALVIGAVAAGQGHLSAVGVVAAGASGAMLGDNLGYWIGRRYGLRLTRVRGVRRVYSERRLRQADDFFARRGWLAVFFGRFVAFLRIFAGPLAGLHRMPWPRFLLANALGAVVWAAIITALGLALQSQLDRALRVVARSGYIGLAVAAAAILVLLAVRRRRRRRCAESSPL
jgi:membrane protein DedA with SNARE-associated domain